MTKLSQAETTRDLVCLLDQQFQFLYLSAAWHYRLNYAPKVLLGRNFPELIHPEDRTSFAHLAPQAQAKGEACLVLRLQDSSGTWLRFQCTCNCIPDSAGHDSVILLVCRDIKDPGRGEQDFQRLAAFPSFNPNPVLELGPDAVVTYANDAAKKMAASLKKEHPADLLPLNASTIVKTCLSTGENRLHVRNSLSGRTLSCSFFPIMAHQVVHCYAEDITDSLNLEAQLRQMKKMESVGQLAAGIAHDFNNVLTVIQGHAGLLLADKNINPLLSESAKQISLAADRAATLTRHLLAFSRKQNMQPQLVDLNEVVGNITKMLKTLLGENITLHRESAAQLPPIFADPGMLEQVLINLAANARDAMSQGGSLSIKTSIRELDSAYASGHPEARPGKFVLLTVRDSGHGMDTEILSRIFEPFFTTKPAGKGTGLGLSTVYGIVKQHRGWMEVQSKPGHGTAFNIFLPASSKAPVKSEGGLDADSPGGDETILVVDDEEPLRELLEEVLQKKGYTVHGASTGAQAMDILRRNSQPIDLLLTDLMMPEGISGPQLAEKARAQNPKLKILYTSGYNPETVHPGLTTQKGANFLQKPFDPEMLARVVRTCLDQ